MRNYADADNLHARIYAMRGRLLSLSDYTSITREQVSDKISGNRNMIEDKEKLFREQIAPVVSLAEAYDKYAPVFLAYLRQYEAHNVKLLLARASGKESLDQWYDIGPYSILNKDLLTKNLSLDEIKSLLADTYLACDFKDISSFRRMEIQMDISTARNLYNASALLSGQAKNEFQEMMLRRIAVLSVIWSYRLRGYYRFRDEQIRSYLKKFHDLFGGHVEPHMWIVEEALNRRIEQLQKSGAQKPSIVDIERHIEQDYYAWVSSQFHRDFHSIYCVIAYLWLLFYQIRNLFRIIDGRRFGFTPEAILNKMICEALG
jgi:vacuolar-type H+-ATPase subunit C/Vma6